MYERVQRESAMSHITPSAGVPWPPHVTRMNKSHVHVAYESDNSRVVLVWKGLDCDNLREKERERERGRG